MLEGFRRPGKASFIVGGQFGSEAKGAAAAFVAAHLAERGELFDIVTTNAASQAGHTSIHKGVKKVLRHLPTIPSIAWSLTRRGSNTKAFLNAGSVIDVDVLIEELASYPAMVLIHPNAATITDTNKWMENQSGSSTTRIASTRKGVGSAIACKVMRSQTLARDEPRLTEYIGGVDPQFMMQNNMSVAVEVPQGIGLSLNSHFYPHATSRDCTVMQAASDAGIHPHFYGASMLVLRTYPIRVGNIVEDGMTVGTSGGHWPDQTEISWDAIGVPPETTTVTGRIRRVFTPSYLQIEHAMSLTRPEHVFISHCDYNIETADIVARYVVKAALGLGYRDPPEFIFGFGLSTDDVRIEL